MALKIRLNEEAPSTVVTIRKEHGDTYLRMLEEIESLGLRKAGNTQWQYKRGYIIGTIGLTDWALLFELNVNGSTVYKKTILGPLGNISASELGKAMMVWVDKMDITYCTAGNFMLKMP